MKTKRFSWSVRPNALPENIVSGESYRFTVLTPRLIRCEFSPSGVFEDRASQSVFYRDFPAVRYHADKQNGLLTLETEHLVLSYRCGAPFSADTLSIRLKNEPASTWHFGENTENLGGTVQTLDCVNGETPLEDGVCSRYGYAVLDDSETMLLNDDGWVEVRTPNTLDFYFFGYGYAYSDAVKDYYRLTGVPPMLPAYALGNWWSRYHKYTQQEYIDLMETFKSKNLPFSVAVVDMDWHIVQIPKELQDHSADIKGSWRCSDGWTGYTWNEELFPDYRQFLDYLHRNNLKTSLNLHPHAGVCPHEKQYLEMAKACGMEPDNHKRVPFDILSPKFMEAYFDILHHPYEEDGVDFWWMDWQQGKSYWWIHEENKDGNMQDEREVLDPLWMLNHLHILDIMRNGKRPMFFSRYSGPGSHRYPVGFSGDTIVTWASLDFQPYFTTTASNIGYAWWSHDIGGHMGGYRDEELLVRWVQLGVFSPINRLHTSNDELVRKEPWTCSRENEHILSDFLRLRHRLFPYLYTMNYRNHHDLEPLVQPMYYHYPKCDAAYKMRNQYFFGSELMVAPITQKGSSLTKMGKTTVFLPQGDWFDFFYGTHYHSENHRTLDIFRTLDTYPVFAKAGAIVPMQIMQSQDNTLIPKDNMEVVVFPGSDNTFSLYEDAGDGTEYQNGAYALTEMQLDYADRMSFTIHAASGDMTLLPASRTWHLNFRGFSDECKLDVFVNEVACETNSEYDEQTQTYRVSITASVKDDVRVEINGKQLMTANLHRGKRCLPIMQRSNFAPWKYNSFYNQLCSDTDSDSKLIKDLRVTAVGSLEEQDLVDALCEQLKLIG